MTDNGTIKALETCSDEAASCGKCIHREVCELCQNLGLETAEAMFGFNCENFKNEADFVEVVRCKDCKYYKKFKGLGNWCHRRIRKDIEYKTKTTD